MGTTLSKSDLIDAVAKKSGETKASCERSLKAMIEVVTTEVAAGNKVQLVGFGTFESVERAARTGINALTKKPMNVAAKKTPKFKAGASFKDAVAGTK